MDKNSSSRLNTELLPAPPNSLSDAQVMLSWRDLKTLMSCVKTIYHLSRLPLFQQRVLPLLPETGRFDPGHDAVMMGYDFHLTPDGPKLIEINTNAGGFLLPWLPPRDDKPSLRTLSMRSQTRLTNSFRHDFAAFSGVNRFPATIAIVDENPSDQFLYPEMLGFARLFAEQGARVWIADPRELECDAAGIHCGGKRIEFLYNRHTDFYLESEPLEGIRKAYLARQVCLSPNPFSYGLLADKRRLFLYRDSELLKSCGLTARDIEKLQGVVLESRSLAAADPESVWRHREDWVFKPVTRFASRGVLLGKKISRKRFDALPPWQTLIQRYAAPSLTERKDEEPMKTDLRLFVYQDRALGILARLYRGQVTNMQTPGGGFAMVGWSY